MGKREIKMPRYFHPPTLRIFPRQPSTNPTTSSNRIRPSDPKQMQHKHAPLRGPGGPAHLNRLLSKTKSRHKLAWYPRIHSPPLVCLLRQRVRLTIPLCQRIWCKCSGCKGVYLFAFSCESKWTLAIDTVNKSFAPERSWCKYPGSYWAAAQWYFVIVWYEYADDLGVGWGYCGIVEGWL